MAEGQSIPEPTERQKEIAAAYQASGSSLLVRKQFRCTHKTIADALKVCGVTMRKPSSGRGTRKSPEFYEKLAADYQANLSIMEVAALNGCSNGPVQTALRERGIIPRRYRHEPPSPFPENIDRQRFGDWLSGFVDGEGTFYAGWNRAFRFPLPAVRFSITLRDDDTDILRLVRSYFGLGRLRTDRSTNKDGCVNRKPRCTYHVDSPKSLSLFVIPHFDQHPLRAKKARDFAIWREAVLLCCHIGRRSRRGKPAGERQWKPEEIAHYQSLHDSLRQQRLYVAQPTQSKAPLVNHG